jgi:osmotically-inducible protein OsmY
MTEATPKQGQPGASQAPAPGVRADRGADEIQSRSADPGQSSYGGFRGENPAYQHEGVDRGGQGGAGRGDATLHDALCERLWRSGIDVSEVTVAVDGGEVTLEGAVATREQRRAIEICVDGCRGVRDISNRIRVAPDRSNVGVGNQ